MTRVGGAPPNTENRVSLLLAAAFVKSKFEYQMHHSNYLRQNLVYRSIHCTYHPSDFRSLCQVEDDYLKEAERKVYF